MDGFNYVLAIGGIFIALFWRSFTSKAIVPLNDPNLRASLNLHD